jgi:hypothetical protein
MPTADTDGNSSTLTESTSAVLVLRQHLADFPILARVDPALSRDLQAGFLLPYLLDFDALTYRRWDYWLEAMEAGRLPEQPIPKIDFLASANTRARKMLETTLDRIPVYGSWQSMGAWEFFRYLLQWMLWGFGHPGYEEPKEPDGCEGASMRVYQTLNICAWMLWPYDLLGDLLAENAYGKSQGFFPTPMCLCKLTDAMLNMEQMEDIRRHAVHDPAVGTGRFLLAASNHCLRLSGQDIDPMMCMATLVNGYLFAPWLVKPFPFLRDEKPDCSQTNRVAERETTQNGPTNLDTATAAQQDDAEVFQFELIRNRRRRANEDERQGRLF